MPGALSSAAINIKIGKGNKRCGYCSPIIKHMNKKLSWLRKAGIAEGISFLVLLGIAMPVKYILKQPIAVSIVGWIHGVLFMAFLFLAWEYKTDRNKSTKWFGTAFLASILPAGTFFFDRKLKEEEIMNRTQS